MTKRYKILQKKVGELDTSFAHLSSLYPAPIPSHLLSDVAQQLVFATKLLSAEISSHPSKPHHLSHISRRLDAHDAALRHYCDHPDHDVTDCGAVDIDDAASKCSCTDSCLNDDGEGDLGSESYCEEPPEMFYEAEEKEEEEKGSVQLVLGRVETSEAEKGGVEIRELKEGGDWGWGYFGVLSGGLVVGVAIGAVLTGFVTLRFSGCFHYIHHQGFLIPT